MKKSLLFPAFLLACSVLPAGAAELPQHFYQPAENADIDYTQDSSRWSFSRSLETDHFLIFWEPDFGSDPNSDTLPEEMRIDVQDLAEKLENFYQTETEALQFGTSGLINDYKLQVYLLYTNDWVATDSGYDNQIAYANTPEANGFSAVKLTVPENHLLHLDFEGLQPGSSLASDDPGIYLIGDDPASETIQKESTDTYNEWDGAAGWRYGIIALLQDGTRQYSPMYQDAKGSIDYTVPENTELLYLVVVGAPETYVPHVWDETEKTDVQMPYRIRFVS